MDNRYNSYFFNDFYAENGGGNYMEKERWIEFFNGIAVKIVDNFAPSSTLEAGCASGYLVKALRDKGVDAYGFDISEYAIAHCDESIKDYVAVASADGDLPEGFPKRYDMVITIEVLEHLFPEQGKAAIAKLCSYADTVLFTSTPDDIEDRTHCNVQQPEYWAKVFADNSFYHDLVQPVDFVCPWAMLFRKKDDICDVIFDYEMNRRIDKLAFDKVLAESGNSTATLYFDNGDGFSEDNSVKISYCGNVIKTGRITLPAGCRSIRFDPVEDIFVIVRNIMAFSSCGQIILSPANAFYDKKFTFFNNTDPQYTANIPAGAIWIEISCNIIGFSDVEGYDTIKSIIAEMTNAEIEIEKLSGDIVQKKTIIFSLKEENQRQIAEKDVVISGLKEENQRQIAEKDVVISGLKEENQRQIAEKESIISYQKKENEIISCELQKSLSIQADMAKQLDNERNLQQQILVQLSERDMLISNMESSFCWRATRPLSKFKGAVISGMDKHSFTRKMRKGISILIHRGPKEFAEAFKVYLQRNKQANELTALTGTDVATVLHSDNKTGYAPYDAEYQADYDFSGERIPDIKLLAFFLPQFYTFPENDEWWGKGFTEWTNVRSGEARFEGHYQPRVPHSDIGYYCMDDINTLKRQAELAKRHGIYGFCFYYYWFSGKRLMEKPVDMLIKHPEIDLPFCLCWANENWTRTWDGLDKHVLIKQDYSAEDEQSFIFDMKKYIDDPRYIRINGKPLIVVYNPGQIPDPRRSFAVWRKRAKELGIGDILIWTCQTANHNAEELKIEDCIDAEVEFPPHNLWSDSIAIRNMDLGGKTAFIYNYQCLVKLMEAKLKSQKAQKVPLHHSFMMAWDNAARRKDGWFTFYAFSLHSLYRWILAIIDRTKKDFPSEERFIFANAWNEWGEGTYLEPDEKYGYANINTVSKALYGLPFNNDIRFLSENSPAAKRKNFRARPNPKLAVQAHVFYLDTLDDIISQMNLIPFEFDCYISTDTPEKKGIIINKVKNSCSCKNVFVKVLPNRGRDVGPFLVQMKPVIDKYEFICHIHSKKTATGEYGDDWRRYNFKHLFGSREYLQRLLGLFEEDEHLGLIFPETYPVLELQAGWWGGNREGTKALLERIGCEYDLPEIPIFPVGNMFWARTAAVRKIFEAEILQEDFPEEAGQTNATLAHQIERAWVYIAASEGYDYCKVFNNISFQKKLALKNRVGVYVHYDKNNVISEEDISSVKAYSEIITELIFVTNCKLDDNELNKVRPYVVRVKERDNIGFDFAAWRDVLVEEGKERLSTFDELVLVNNSCLAPVFGFAEMFAEMDERNQDFWGNTVFPYSPDGGYINRDCIPEHLQSYFMVFRNSVIKSDVFWSFWENVKDYETLIDVIANCESQLTKVLSDAGFTYGVYIHETYYISKYLMNYAIPYEKPVTMLLLGNTFVKKKCYDSIDEEERVKLERIIKKVRKKY